MSQTKTQPKTASNKPVQEIVAWPLRIAIWRHEGNGNGATFSTKLTKSFRRKDSEDWESTEYLSDSDLLAAARLHQQAWDWIVSDRERAHARA